MHPRNLVVISLLALCTACPPADKPNDKSPSSGEGPADGDTGPKSEPDPGTPAASTETGGTETGSAAAPVCEDQLAECNALLDACVAKMPD